MTTSFAEDVYSSIMNMGHEWTYEEVTELMELLDEKQEELAKEFDYGPEEFDIPPMKYSLDEGDYSIIEKENVEAIIDLPY